MRVGLVVGGKCVFEEGNLGRVEGWWAAFETDFMNAFGVGGGVKSTRFGYAFTVRKLGLPPDPGLNAYYGPSNTFPVAFCDIGRRRGSAGGKTAAAIGPEVSRGRRAATVRTVSFSRVAAAAGGGSCRRWWP